MRPIRVLTWHVHGNYLWYLSQCSCEFYLPVKSDRSSGYGGRGETFPFPPNVHEVPAHAVREQEIDCVLYQCKQNYLHDRFEILSSDQRQLPSIYLEHDPPQDNPTEMRHWVDDPEVLLVHVTAFNRLMWDCGRTPTRVIEHGVLRPEGHYSGELPRGIVVVNNLRTRGRRLGLDVFESVRQRIPLDLVGMDAQSVGGLGEVPPTELGRLIGRYRFFFNPIRYTSLGLAVCEAMSLGMPIVGLATTEMATAIKNGVSGFIDTSVEKLMNHMQQLLANPELAHRMGEAAQAEAAARFGIRRFAADWDETFRTVTAADRSRRTAPHSAAMASI